MHMTDETVYELAKHFFIIEDIARHFNVSTDTVLNHHGDAFRMGKMNHVMKRRVLYDQMITPLIDSAIDWTDPKNAGVASNAMKLMEMGWKKNEGYGATLPEAPIAEEKPSVSEIRFTPLNKSD